MTDYRSPWMDDDLELFRDAARRFVENEIVPNDARWREQHHVDRDLWNKAGEVGLLCTDIPDQYGGVGGDARHEAVVVDRTFYGHDQLVTVELSGGLRVRSRSIGFPAWHPGDRLRVGLTGPVTVIPRSSAS